MSQGFVTLREDHSASPLYSEDLAPVPASGRTWGTGHLTALWIGMAVCIPTYLLASYMMRDGLSWVETLLIIGLANVIVTIPMVLNGHAGVKYGIPFPVIGRAPFGIRGIHIASVLRGFIACGWFGVQTWIGGLAIYAIFTAATGTEGASGLSAGKFVAFGVFWLINMYFVWKGNESIKWLEVLAAPILLLMGIALIVWGSTQSGSFRKVLDQSNHLADKTSVIEKDPEGFWLLLNPLHRKHEAGFKADAFRFTANGTAIPPDVQWQPLDPANTRIPLGSAEVTTAAVQFRGQAGGKVVESSVIAAAVESKSGWTGRVWKYVLWLTIMVGFWATMSISIADITRYARSQKAQVSGQFLGLPTTMMLYSFIGVFVTCAAMINFDDVLIADDAPWDPVSLMGKFENPVVVIFAQLAMLVATLSTNIAANVIAPANAFSNLWPRRISFRAGGYITGLVGIVVCPWLLMNEISSLLQFVSGLLGPVLGVMIADYYAVRKMKIDPDELYREHGTFAYGGSGFNPVALAALAAGMGVSLAGYFIPALSFLYTTSWFTGFIIAFALYYVFMKNRVPAAASFSPNL
jgi:cytosine/uracil/thiamine/allantoin permease